MRNAFVVGLLLATLLLVMMKRILRRRLVRRGLKTFGDQALDKQPDSIRLRRRSFNWQNQAAVQNLTGPLLARSFSEVGDFSIAQISQLKVRFLVKPSNSIWACVYEHPKAGVWLELVSRSQDGSVASFSTAHDPGIEPRPQDTIVYAPELSADMLYTRMVKERPQRAPVSVDAKSVVNLFEDTYRDQVQWRKKANAPAPEVQEVRSRRAPSLGSHRA